MPETRARFKANSAKIKQIVVEGCDLTPEEWASLDAGTEDLMAKDGTM